MNAPPAGRPDVQTPRIGVEALLARLDRAQQSGNGWRADCPAGHKARGSLSIAQGDDGRILLHCFAGCSTADVLGALGLSVADLMPERLRDESPQGRRAARERFKLASVQAATGVLARESEIVLIAATDTMRGTPLSGEDFERVMVAVDRIRAAREAML